MAFRLRGRLDRLVGGRSQGVPPPGRPLLAEGDRVGFWRVDRVDRADMADGEAGLLVLQALVRAPGRVLFRTQVRPVAAQACELTQSVSFTPSGATGAAYLVADLPAREALLTLVHRRTCAEVRRRCGAG